MSLLRLQRLCEEQEEKNYSLAMLGETGEYTRFMERMVLLEKKVDRKRGAKRFDEFRANLSGCLCAVDQIDREMVER